MNEPVTKQIVMQPKRRINMKSYVLVYEDGDYEDFSSRPILIFDDKTKANQITEDLNKYKIDWMGKINNVYSSDWDMDYAKKFPIPIGAIGAVGNTRSDKLNYELQREKTREQYIEEVILSEYPKDVADVFRLIVQDWIESPDFKVYEVIKNLYPDSECQCES